MFLTYFRWKTIRGRVRIFNNNSSATEGLYYIFFRLTFFYVLFLTLEPRVG